MQHEAGPAPKSISSLSSQGQDASCKHHMYLHLPGPHIGCTRAPGVPLHMAPRPVPASPMLPNAPPPH